MKLSDLNKPFFGQATKIDRWRWQTKRKRYIIDRRWFLAAFLIMLGVGAIAFYQAYFIGPPPPYISSHCPAGSTQACTNRWYAAQQDPFSPMHELAVAICGDNITRRPEPVCNFASIRPGETLEIRPPGIAGDAGLYVLLLLILAPLLNHGISNRRFKKWIRSHTKP